MNTLRTFRTCRPWTSSVLLSNILVIGLSILCKVIGMGLSYMRFFEQI